MFSDIMDFCMKLLKAEWKVNQQEGGEVYDLSLSEIYGKVPL